MLSFAHSIELIETEHRVNNQKSILYLAFTVQLWGVYYEHFEENLPRFNGAILNVV